MKISGIYILRNMTNGKVYVGSSVNIKLRWSQHRCALNHGLHGNWHLQAAWQKYGNRVFDFQIHTVCPVDELSAQEEQVIAEFQAADLRYGYNMHRLVEGRVVMSDETRAKMSAWQLGKVLSPETKAKLGAVRKGRKVDETLRRSTNAKISAAMKGRIFSEEHKAALRKSADHKTRPNMTTPEAKAKRAATWQRKREQRSSGC